MTKQTIKVRLARMDDIRLKYHVKRLGLFGSFVNGSPKRASDIDVLVEFLKIPDLFSFAALSRELKGRLGRNVDLVTLRALKPIMKQQILKEVKWL